MTEWSREAEAAVAAITYMVLLFKLNEKHKTKQCKKCICVERKKIRSRTSKNNRCFVEKNGVTLKHVCFICTHFS